MAHYRELATVASARQLESYIATAQPPGSPLYRKPEGRIPDFSDPGVGSNGWAFGRDRAAAGGGMLLGNPHFPWDGELRLYESHIRVPGEVDVYGAALLGVVGVLIGFNENVAWTHTVSAGNRFTFYILQLDPTDPTRYMYDGQSVAMESTELTVDVLQADGSIVPQTRTLWRSQFGPIANVTGVGWSNDLVLSYRDTNIGNASLIEQFYRMNRAESMDDFQAAHAEVQGIPWVNTISTSSDGRAWYADTGPTPNLSPAAIEAWENSDDLIISTLKDNGAVGLDGSTSVNAWVEEPGAREPGLVPYARMPQIERSDFVYNANDSYWLSNPDQPLLGFSPLHGATRVPQSPRSRMNLRTLTDLSAGGPYGPDGKLDLDELATAALSNRGVMAELLADEVVARCMANPSIAYAGQTVDLQPICTAIANWDRRLDLDSVGAVAWREFLGDYDYKVMKDRGVLFEVPFNPDNPIETPTGLAAAADVADDDRALQALAAATLRLQAVGLSPTTTLRESQFTLKGGERIPMHGGSAIEGVTNLIVYGSSASSGLDSTLGPKMERGELQDSSSGLTTLGYPVIYGSSFILAMEFTPDGPQGRAFVTYSQSSDPNSPHFADQTHRFSEKDWRTIRFTEEDILADPELEVETVSGSAE
jgi:acyl-homoserine-lactone acylase